MGTAAASGTALAQDKAPAAVQPSRSRGLRPGQPEAGQASAGHGSSGITESWHQVMMSLRPLPGPGPAGHGPGPPAVTGRPRRPQPPSDRDWARPGGSHLDWHSLGPVPGAAAIRRAMGRPACPLFWTVVTERFKTDLV